MDDVRGTFGNNENTDHTEEWDDPKSASGHDGPPASIGQDERRMQVRAYNHWAGLLGERNFPSIEELNPQDITDFGPNSVLLDFSAGIDDPAVQYLGDKLAKECGATGQINQLSDVPTRSLLSRITDHYMQILANQAPIGFEAEFVNREGASILYRGILLPYSSDDETIDFIYGVINWKEMADQATADELLLEIDQALESEPVDEDEAHKHPSDPVTAWAPSSLDDFDELSALGSASQDRADSESDEDVFELELAQIDASEPEMAAANDSETAQPSDTERGKTASLLDIRGCDAAYDHELTEDFDLPDFAQYKLEDPEEEEHEDEDFESGEDEAAYHFASLADYIETPTKKAIDLDAEVNVPEGFDANTYDGSYDEETAEPAPFGTAEEHSLEPAEDPLELDQVFEIEVEAQDGEPAGFVDDAQVTPLVLDMETKGSDFAGDTPHSAAIVSQDAMSHQSAAVTDQADDQPALSELSDALASARELAQNALHTEDRSRQALYAAVGRAYDFSLAAQDAPEDYQQLIEESGLSVQERAPMTPIVKLVFGSEYDKTRLTEYAAVLAHAHRRELGHGSLGEFLGKAEGGLKGVVQAERQLRREESGKAAKPKDTPRAALAKKLRKLEAQTLADISADGPEFALFMVRRDGEGNVSILGEIGDDAALIERAAKKLTG